MAYSYNEVTATGSAQLIAVPEYVDQAHIKVSINGVDTTSFTWTNASTVSVTATAGATVRVYRSSSPGARVVDYQDGMSLTEAVLDADSKQAFFLAQEQLDATDEAVGAYGSLASTLTTIQAETLASSNNATAAAASASSASTSAATATTKASEASASAATATTKAGEASTSAADAASSASSASTSASTATTKASEASTSASNAAASASNAATSASQAAASASSMTPSSSTPAENGGSGVVGVASAYARGDHAHPVTTKTYGDATTAPATTAFVDALRDVPPQAKSVSYTLALTDRGQSIDFTGSTGQTITIPANASVAFPVGTVISITNTTANNLSIAITTDTLRQAGTANTGTRTLGQYGMVTLRKVASTVWFISGSGLT